MADRGRPSKYTDELADLICERISDGESLVDICKSDGMPSRGTVFRWLAGNETFQDMYALAREVQAEHYADEIVAISDDSRNDWMERNSDGATAWALNGEAIARSRLRVDARKWVASKLKPRKYGDRSSMELTGAEGGPLEVNIVIGGHE